MYREAVVGGLVHSPVHHLYSNAERQSFTRVDSSGINTFREIHSLTRVGNRALDLHAGGQGSHPFRSTMGLGMK